MNRDPRVGPTTLADLRAWLASEEAGLVDTRRAVVHVACTPSGQKLKNIL